ncbi:MAG: hypothetical protein K6G46_02780, partial [Prevotella sp.]|nr:hypothetical protein [Prevotella sp.]
MRNRILHMILFTFGLLMVGGGQCVMAQFHEMESLPWVPQRPGGQTTVDNGSSSVLEDLANALQNGQYKQVVDRYYPLAISNGYQR